MNPLLTYQFVTESHPPKLQNITIDNYYKDFFILFFRYIVHYLYLRTMRNQKAYRITIFFKEVHRKMSVTQVQFDNDLTVTLKLFQTQPKFS